MKNSKTRFSSRVDDYLKYRPKYPLDIIDFLQKTLELTSNSIIADIGSGTGFLSELFLQNGNKVYGIEPNKEMRQAGENYLQRYSNFVSINSSAEETLLDDNSIDFVVAGQAYHWFNPKPAKKEFIRILKHPSENRVVLIWNSRNIFTDLGVELETLIEEFSTDYRDVSFKGRYTKEEQKDFLFFENRIFKRKLLKNHQILDFTGFLGRLTSSSYMISKTDSRFENLKKETKKLFNKYQQDGKIQLEYNTEVYYGNLS